jgi:hypothetical protein
LSRVPTVDDGHFVNAVPQRRPACEQFGYHSRIRSTFGDEMRYGRVVDYRDGPARRIEHTGGSTSYNEPARTETSR